MIVRVLWYLGVLLRNQWLSPERLRKLQDRKLRRLVRHAYDNVPYYRRLFDGAKLKPEDIRTVDDLERVPITTKEQFQGTPLSERLCRGIDPAGCEVIRTSGSTGLPLRLYRTPRECDMRVAAEARMLFACLKRPFPRFLGVTMRALPLAGGLLRKGPWRTMRVNPGLGPKRIAEIARRFRPHVLWGYPSRLHLLARTMQEEPGGPIRIETAITGSETLDPAERADIGRIFGAEVFDAYGAHEFGRIGWECRRHTGVHLCTDSYVVEVVRSGRRVKPGEPGEAVVTALDLRAMPMIRYLLGDIFAVSEERCPCGRGFPLVKAIEGRRDDVVTLPDGRILSSRDLSEPVYDIPGVKQFKVIQDRPDHVVVEIVRTRDFPPDGVERLQKFYHERQPALKMTVRFVSNIPRDPSGKLRKIISLVTPDAAGPTSRKDAN